MKACNDNVITERDREEYLNQQAKTIWFGGSPGGDNPWVKDNFILSEQGKRNNDYSENWL